MRLIYAFLFHLGAFMAGGHHGYFVLTRFEGLERYAKLLAYKSRYLPEEEILGSGLQLCIKLLAAPLVELIPGSTPQYTTTTNIADYQIADNEWKLLKNEFAIKEPIQRVVIIGDKVSVVWTRLCVSHDPEITWVVAPDKTNYIGLLFDYGTRGMKLFAIIDYSRRLTTINVAKNFHDVVEQASPEDLCNLKKQSQTRLCALSADGLHRSKNIYRGSNLYYQQSGNSYRFKDPKGNFMYSSTLGICPNITVKSDFRNEPYFTNGLRCEIFWRNYDYIFYVKRNLKNAGLNSTVFVIEQLRPNSNVLKGEVAVRQLDEMFFVDEYIVDDN